ncbi:hypothetical protein [Leptolyngbya sp. GGD]|uniref:hypothetical protein n=1 Tax=Leptolyngbya sp. GGD TaxID=2997907 RepID=UPI00227D2F6C|nr:hypothetical protein [Leptolyngbya sp. GGD]MCY6491429.1 hypothetical protein [Leptolyngbya sp. GGD]
MTVRNEMEDFHCKYLSDAQMRELNPMIRNAIATALYTARNYSEDEASFEWTNFQLKLIPEYWEEPELTEDFRKLVKSLRRHREALQKSSGTAGEP